MSLLVLCELLLLRRHLAQASESWRPLASVKRVTLPALEKRHDVASDPVQVWHHFVYCPTSHITCPMLNGALGRVWRHNPDDCSLTCACTILVATTCTITFTATTEVSGSGVQLVEAAGVDEAGYLKLCPTMSLVGCSGWHCWHWSLLLLLCLRSMRLALGGFPAYHSCCCCCYCRLLTLLLSPSTLKCC